MTKSEIKQFIEEQFDYHMSEFDLTREEAEEVVLINTIGYYYEDKISQEDLIECTNYLGCKLDLDAIEKEKAEKKKRAEYRKQLRERKKAQKGK